MIQQNIPQRKRLAAVFASCAVLVMGTASLLQSMSLDYYSVLNTIQKIIPAGFALGALGWVIGMILDKPKRRQKVDYNHLFLNDVMKNDLANVNNSMQEEPEENKDQEIENQD